jgi:hypothetical protein
MCPTGLGPRARQPSVTKGLPSLLVIILLFPLRPLRPLRRLRQRAFPAPPRSLRFVSHLRTCDQTVLSAIFHPRSAISQIPFLRPYGDDHDDRPFIVLTETKLIKISPPDLHPMISIISHLRTTLLRAFWTSALILRLAAYGSVSHLLHYVL